jgi:branched-chain amino acid aminotransferase
MALSNNSSNAADSGQLAGIMTYLNFNGSILPVGTAIITADDPGFRHGDGLFETIRVENSHIFLSNHHFDRLFAGAAFLGFDLAGLPSRAGLCHSILTLCDKNSHSLARVRLTIFRRNDEGGDAHSRIPAFCIQSWPLLNPDASNSARRGKNPGGLHLGLFPDGRKSLDCFANLKSNNYLLYTRAAEYARRLPGTQCLRTSGR